MSSQNSTKLNDTEFFFNLTKQFYLYGGVFMDDFKN